MATQLSPGAATTAPPDARPAAGAAVRFDRIEKRFGEVVAVDDVSLEIEPGEFVTLLGPSGSGKTTTLLMLAGFELPTAGEIYVDGRPIVAVPPYRRNIGMVFQSYALFPHMTVFENIAFPLKMRRESKAAIRERVAEALRIVNLPGYEARFPRQLSGGQQQRVALARAIVFNPPVLLMDEPLGALDKQLRERLQLEIKRIHRELGVTVIYVTHDQEEALVLSDRIAVMNHGRIEQVGTPTDLYDHPQNRFVASFIGESNFLDGRYVGPDEPARNSVVVRLPSGLVGARSPIELQPDQAVTIAVRPEKLAFGGEEFAEGSVDYNRLPATVREVIFVGEIRRYTLELSDGTTLAVKQPSRAGVQRYEPGDRVDCIWHVADTQVVEAR